MIHVTRALARTCLFALVFASGAAQAAFTDIFVFGDSLSDTGNVLIANGGMTEVQPYSDLVPDRPYAFGGGRFSNGPVWVEYLAADLGLGLAPSNAGGNGYAWGGARSGALPNVAPSSVSITDQANQAVAVNGGALPGDALYALWGGGNDIREAAVLAAPGPPQAIADAQAVIAAGVQNLSAAITTLALAGANTILLPNAPDVGLTPAAQALGPLVAAGITQFSAAYNLGLANAVDALEANLGIQIIEVDAFGLVNQVVANPAAFGLTNVSDPCIFGNGGLGCSDPENYLFWDGIHPTTVAHQLIAEAALAAIPLPPAMVLFLAPAVALLRRRATS